MTKLHEVNRLGQSIWYDNIRRALLEQGDLQALIEQGVTGVTSNPTIFEKAIVGSSDYDADLRRIPAGQPVGAVYEALALDDIRHTADLLRPVYTRTDGADGYVSLEVSPALAHNTAGTIAEAQRLFAALERPNVMIKIPATPAGIPAITATIAAGINVNVTLIFAVKQYQAVLEAYMRGLELLIEQGGDPARVASVASFFVSRVDSSVDQALTQRGRTDLAGMAGIANAKVAYAHFRESVNSPRRQVLAARGARVQRPLWASTGVKNPDYSDTLYVDNLIGPDTVNTMPPAALDLFLDHGSVAATLEQHLDEARAHLDRLADAGIDLEAITDTLLDEGVAAFAQSFESLMAGIATKRRQLPAEQPEPLEEMPA